MADLHSRSLRGSSSWPSLTPGRSQARPTFGDRVPTAARSSAIRATELPSSLLFSWSRAASCSGC